MTDDATSTPSLSPLQRAFLALEESRARVAELEAAAREPIAIIGMGCRFPGGADSPATYWELLKDGRDATGPIPAERWDVDALYDADPEAPGHIATKQGAFLENIDRFDPTFFGITRREAQGMDPQQRLFLEVCWEALEHAGHAPDRLERSPTGIYAGLAGNDYAYLQLETHQRELLDAHFASGMAHSIASGRVSYLLGLHGPSLTMDTACSSSLVAVHLAAQALRAGDCRMALAGGVNLILSPDIFVALSHARMLAPDGRCKTFDAAADGFARGEGCGVVVLKKLSDAMADGDRVLAVIRGTAVNQDGPSSGLTAPNGPQQESVIREALSRAGVAPSDVSYVEAHGTGTQLGDPLEMHALGAVFGDRRTRTQPLLVGSVKTNIGHVEAAAGVAGLIKLVLALQHKEIPAHLNFTQPSPHIDWDAYAVDVPRKTMPWPAINNRRVAGLSSFGFSGTNAHVVVESAPEAVRPSRTEAREHRRYLFVLSARDAQSLAKVARSYANAFAAFTDADLAGVCRAAAIAKAHHEERATILAESMEHLRGLLGVLADGGEAEGLRTRRVTRRDPARVAFLYTGQGSQYAGMAHALYEREPVFRAAVDRCAEIADAQLSRPLRDVMFGVDGAAEFVDDTEFVQPALFAIEYAVTELWRSWGVTPDIVIGHSIGEIVAACVAEVFSLDDAMQLVLNRARLMQQLSAGGGMAAVAAPEQTVAVEIAPHARFVSVAAINAPGQTVVSGAADVVDSVCGRLMLRGIRCNKLRVSHAFHSPLIEPMLDAFEQVAGTLAYSAPRLRLISNLTGRVADARDVTTPSYWRRHVREPVRFAEGASTLHGLAPDVCVEVGPQATLLPLLEQNHAADGRALVASLRKGRADLDQIADALGAMFLEGVALDWRAVWREEGAPFVDLPAYPYERERCWFADSTRPAEITRPPVQQITATLAGTRVRTALERVVVFESLLGPRTHAFIRDHRVGGRVIMPATGFIALALDAARQAFEESRSIRELAILESLVFPDDASRMIQVIVQRDRGSFTVHSAVGDAGDTWVLHAEGEFAPADAAGNPESAATIRQRCVQRASGEEHYARLAGRGLEFGPSLAAVHAIFRRDGEALAELRVTANTERDGVVDPALLDACIQPLSEALPARRWGNRRYLPLAVESVTVHRNGSAPLWSHVTLRALPEVRDAMLIADVVAFDAAGVVAELRGIRLRADVQQDRGIHRSLYQTVWHSQDAAWTPTAATLSAEVGVNLERLSRTHRLSEYNAAFMALESLSVAWIVAAFRDLGWTPRAGDEFTAEGLASELRVAKRYHRLVSRYLAILCEEGYVNRTPAGWTATTVPPARDANADVHAVTARHPSSRARLVLASNAGARLSSILRGDADPLDALFPGGSSDIAESLYRDAPEARVFGTLMHDALAALVSRAPRGQPLRVLEVGGGTAGTTSQIIGALPPDAEYTFTDIGPLLVERAREKFAGRAGMRFQVFDLERGAAEQGLDGGSFDVIIASNVVHATSDIRATLTKLRDLLASGGMLLMLEVAGYERWIDITFGLTDGWWRFTDTDVRADYPLLTRSRWLPLLRSIGFEASAIGEEHHETREVLLAARAPVAAGALKADGRWLILSDAGGVGADVAKRLLRAGQKGTVLRRLNKAGRPVREDELRTVIAGQGDISGILHLWGLDIAAPDERDAADLVQDEQAVIGTLLTTVQSVAAGSYAGMPPELWIATRGAVAIDGRTPLNVLQSPVLGMRRSIALEHEEMRARTVDLDPAMPVEAQGETLHRALCSAGAEQEIVARGTSFAVPRLAPVGAGGPRANVRLEQTGRGVLDDVALRAVARRAPGPGEVEIQMRAAGLNFRDVLNALAMRDDPEPLGGECAGRVTRVGEGVTGIAPGDDVVAIAEAAFANYVVADARDVVPLPAGMTFAAAATLPFTFMTAYHALVVLGSLQPGETVLIHAGAGGVGLAAIQIAQHIGATVMATASSDEKRDYLRRLGVEHVFHSRDLSFEHEIEQLTKGEGVDVVLNSLAGDFMHASVRALAPKGRFLEIGKRDILTPAEFAKYRPDGRYFAIDLAAMRRTDAAHARALFARVMRDAGAAVYRPLPYHTFPLTSGGDAFRFMAQARHIGKIVLTGSTAGALEALSPHGVYLITGGLTGLGLLTAQLLSDRGARTLVLTGRREPSSDALDAIREMERLGATVHVERADVSEPLEVSRLLSAVRALNKPLRGVVHSAGVLADGALTQQTWDRFAEPLGPKVNGSWALHAMTQDEDLDFFVMYSSLASVLGSAGQANHAAANAFLDALASHRHARGLPAHAISWGPWSEIGAAADRNVDVSGQGIRAITPDEGVAMIEAILDGDAPHVAAFHMDGARFFDANGAHQRSRYLDVLRADTARRAQRTQSPMEGKRQTVTSLTTPTRQALVDELRPLSPSRRQERLIAFVTEHVARVVGAPTPASIDPTQPLNEMGLDSLMAVELRNRLGAGLGVARSLPATIVFDHPTVNALAEYLARTLASDTTPAPTTEAGATTSIGELSDQQIEELFANKTKKR